MSIASLARRPSSDGSAAARCITLFTVIVAPVNDDPTIADGEYEGDEDAEVSFEVEIADVDHDTAALLASRPTNPTGNVLTDDEVAHLDEIARQRGREAVTWAIPAVSMLRFRDAYFGLGGGYNSVYYLSEPPTAQTEALK